ncbi:transglycosylase domain-containing protein [Actinomyces marmotae]|uniref:Penicillin-binding protein n=1 Tax=Actinomyces marmotae TaxID=2737173 RepID=A0A6M8B6B1_9ACTO|nr:transglycosylase domain-containing protein [Actinomyces marmotae]QKD78981.1 penicillin-binding protein [Actinomyces marmotae]
MSKTSARTLDSQQLLSALLAFIVMSTVGGLLVSGFAVPFVGAASVISKASREFFEDLPDDFKVLEPSQVSVLRAADGTEIAQFYAENRIVVPLKDISKNVRNAVIAVEDQRFYQHEGVDPTGMLRALASNAAGADRQGASTLTQQYVRNVLVEAGIRSGDPAKIRAATEPTTARKLREIKYALTLEKTLPDAKNQILEGYLNIAAFSPSTYGVEASAQHYFSHSAKEMTIAEAALLAGLTNAPGAYDPVSYPDLAKDRMNWVLQKMLDNEFIDQAQYDEAVATQVSDILNVTNHVGGCASAGSAAYFCDYVVGEIQNSELFGKTATERNQLLLRGGLQITTTLDLRKQKAADDTIANYVPIGDPSNVKGAIVAVEPGTGKIQAMAQNTSYGTDSSDPSVSQISYSADYKHGGIENNGFQPGSSFKPFVLAQWYQMGRSGYETMNTDPTTFPAANWNISCSEDTFVEQWKVGNANPGEGGTHSVVQSTAMSINVAYAKMIQQMDICAVTSLAAKMGMTKADGNPIDPRPSITLGTMNVPPLNMANAYATFAAHGVYCKPIAINKVTDHSGTEMAVPSADCSQVMDQTAADRVALTLTHVFGGQGTAKNHGLAGRPAAGKTGTTEEMDNAWFVGFTPQLSTAVWMGHSEGTKPMNGQYIGGRYYATMYGSDAPAPMWKQFMDTSLAGTGAEPFTQVSLGAGQPAQPSGGNAKNTSGQFPGLTGDAGAQTAQAPQAATADQPGTVAQADADLPAGQLPGSAPTAASRKEFTTSLSPAGSGGAVATGPAGGNG